MDKKSIFGFSDYRLFLKFYIKQLPQSRGILKTWADHLGVHSTMISQVMMGKRDYNEDQALELARFMGLSKIEIEYFLEQVRLARAGTVSLRRHIEDRMNDLKSRALQLSERLQVDRTLGEQESSVFYSSWIYSAVRMCCTLGDGLTVDEIALKLQTERDIIIKALNFLRETGFVKQNGACYVIGTQYTHLAKSSPYLTRHHSNWRLKALQKADQISDQELMYTSVFSISKKDFETLRESLVLVIQHFLKSVKASEGEVVACFGLDLFKVT
jgi:uncharacterized protein (TIGR02147 family)